MSKYFEDENGYITFPDAMLSRSGIFKYLGREISEDLEPDRVYTVYRPEEEISSPDAIESFKLAPWFPHHEMAGDEYRDAGDIGVQGTTGQDVRYVEGKGMVGTVKVFGSKLRDAIKQGLKELSCGFRCTWDIVSGVSPDGVKYDVVQRNIRGNHLASVEEGRAGPQFAIAMDRACIALDELTEEGQTMTLEELLELIAKGQFSEDDLKSLMAKVKEMMGGEEAEDKSYDEDKAEDMEKAEDEGKAEDMDKSEDSDKPAMDAMMKEIKALQKQVKSLSGNALDAKAIERQINEKSQLIKDLEPVIGRVDGTGLDSDGVAKKAADILGIACDSKSALAAVRGYLHAQTGKKTTIDNGTAQDAATATDAIKKLDEMGL